MVMHLNVLGWSMENRVFGKLNVVEIIKVDWDRFGDFGNSLFNRIGSHVATTALRYSTSVLNSATVGSLLLL